MKEFSAAIAEAINVPDAKWLAHVAYCDANDSDGFLTDFLSALCEGKQAFLFGHEKRYYEYPGNKEKEAFANLFSLEAYGDREKLDYVKNHFPKVYQAYNDLEPTL